MQELTETVPSNNQKRHKVIQRITLGFGLLALLALLYWWLYLFHKASTDDAYVGGNKIAVNARVTGTIIAYYADDTDLVVKGQKLVLLDPLDYMLILESRKAALEQAVRDISALEATVAQNKALLEARKADLALARINFGNREGLVDSQAISGEDFDRSKLSLSRSEADVAAAEQQWKASLASLGTGPLEEHPRVLEAKANLREAYLNLTRCTILAPVTGYVAQRSAQLGQHVTLTKPLMAIIPLDQIWVDANFKETQLANIRIGQPVHLKSDMYGSRFIFHGKVLGIEPGSGSVFSLLPPQNATGNWIKVVQRVPVRIGLDPKEIKEWPLMLGLSMYTTILTKDVSGKRLAELLPKQEIDSTSVYDIDTESMERWIEAIIKSNKSQ